MSERDDRAIISKNEGGGIFYNCNMESTKAGIRTLNVNFDKMSKRKCLFGSDQKGKNPVSYADRVMNGVDITQPLKTEAFVGKNVLNMAR